MDTDRFTLPLQLSPYSIGYSDGKATVVTMRTADDRQYLFQPLSDKRYAVMYQEAGSVMMRTTSIAAQEAPAVLNRIFQAGTLERILELQASRQIVECVHRNRR